MKAIYVLLVLSLALSGQALAQLKCTYCTVTPITNGTPGTPESSTSTTPVDIVTAAGGGTFTGTIVLTGNSEFSITGTGHYTIDGVISSSGTTTATSLTLSATSAGGWGGKDAGIIFAGTTANTYTGETIIKSGFIACKKTAGVVAIPGYITFKPGSTATPEASLWFGANNQLSGEGLLKFDRTGGAVAAAMVNLNGTTQTLLGIDNAVGEKDIIGNVNPANTTSILDVPKNTNNKATLVLTGIGTTTRYTFSNNAELRGLWLPTSPLTDNAGLEIQVNGATQLFDKPSNIKYLTFNTGAAGTLEVSATGAVTDVSAFGYGVTFKGTGTIKKTGGAVITMDASTISQSGGKIWVKEGVLRNKNDGNNATNYPTSDTERNKAVLQVDDGAAFDIYGRASIFGGLTGGLTGSGTVENNWKGRSTLTLNLNDDQTFAGVIKNNATTNQEISDTDTGKGGVNLTKEGNGTQTLTGNNLYSGSTTVSSGTLKLLEGGKLQGGTYAGGLEIANVTTGTAAVFEHSGTQTQVFSGVISSSGTGTGANLGTFLQSGGTGGTGKSIINGTNTFTGKVDITAGFLGGTGDLSKANGVTVGSSGSIGGGNGVDAGGTLIVSNLTFSADGSKLIVTPASSTDGTPSLVDVRTAASSEAGSGLISIPSAGNKFTVDLLGTNLRSGYIIKCSNGIDPATGNRRFSLPDSPVRNTTGKTPFFKWDSKGLYMTLAQPGLVCDNCSFTRSGSTTAVTGTPGDPAVILSGSGEFSGDITLTGNCNFTIGGTGNYTLSGRITGDYSLTYNAPGAAETGLAAGFTLGGSGGNDYGLTTLTSGYIICNKTNGAALPKNVKVSAGAGEKVSIWCLVNAQFGAETVIDFTDAKAISAFYLNGTTQTAAGLKADNAFAVIANSKANDRPAGVNAGASAATLNIAALTGEGKTYTFGGGGSIYKGGTADLTVNVTSGTQIIQNPGAGIHDVTLSSDQNATLEFNTADANVYNMGGTGDGAVILKGAGTIKKTGAGTVTMSKATIVKSAGEIWVAAGILKNGEITYNEANASNEAILKLENGTTFDIWGNNSLFGGLTGGGQVHNNLGTSTNNGYNDLTLNQNNTTDTSPPTFSGVIKDNSDNASVGAGAGRGGIALKKEGNGIQVLTGVNLYTGSTTVSAGTLRLGGGGKLKEGTYAGGLEIANVSTTGTTPAVFEHKGTATQVFSGVISSTGTGTGANLGTFRQSGDGKSIITNTANTFTGKVDITGGFLGGSGNLSKANGVFVQEHGSIGGGNGVDAGGTLIVSNLSFKHIASKLIVTPASLNGTIIPSLVDVRTTATNAAEGSGSMEVADGAMFKIDVLGTMTSGYVIKCTSVTNTAAPSRRPQPVLGANSTGKYPTFHWDTQGLYMTLQEVGLVCDNCSFTRNGQSVSGSTQNPAVILAAAGTFDGEIALTDNCKFTIGGTGDYILSGKIIGAYSLTYSAPATSNLGLEAGFTLSGGASNDYRGSTTLENGYLICSKSGGNTAAIPKDIKLLSKDGKRANIWCLANNQFGSETVIDFTGAEYEANVYINGTTQTAAGLKADNAFAMIVNSDVNARPAVITAALASGGAATLNIAALEGKTCTFGGGGSINKGGAGSSALTVNVTSGTQIIQNPGGGIHDVTLSSDSNATLEFNTAAAYSVAGGTGDGAVILKGAGTIKKKGAGTVTMSKATLSKSAGEIWVAEGTLQNGTQSIYQSGEVSNKAILKIEALTTSTPTFFDIRGINSLFGGLTGSGQVYNNLGPSTGSGYNTLTLNQDGADPSTFSGTIRDNSTNAGVEAGEGKGGISLKKEGSGTQVLTGFNFYTGSTTVSAGTLKLGGTGRLKDGTYAGGLEIANVTTGTAAVFEHNGTQPQVFSGVISSSGTGTGANLGTFRQSGTTGKSIINGTNTFTGNVDITGGFLGGSGDLSKAASVTVGASGSIGGGPGTADANGTLIVPNLTFSGADSKLIVTASADGTLSLVEVKTSTGSAGTLTAANRFKVDLVGTNLKSGYILKGQSASSSYPLPVAGGSNTTGKSPSFHWDSDGLYMTLTETGLRCDNCSFTGSNGAVTGLPGSPAVILAGPGEFSGNITLNGDCNFTIGGTGNYTLSGNITGGTTHSLTYNAPSAGNENEPLAGFTLSGSGSNQYGGTTTLTNGYIICNKTGSVALPGDVKILSKNHKIAAIWCLADNQFGSQTAIDFTGAEYNAAVCLNGTTQRAAGLKANNGYANVKNVWPSYRPAAISDDQLKARAAALNIAAIAGTPCTFGGGGNINEGETNTSLAITVNVTSGTQIIQNPKIRGTGSVIFTSAQGATLELSTSGSFGGGTTTIQGEGILKKTGAGTIGIHNSALLKSAGEIWVYEGILQNGEENIYNRDSDSNKAILRIEAPTGSNPSPAFDIRGTNSLFGGLTGGGQVYNGSSSLGYTDITLNPSGSSSTFAGAIRDNPTDAEVSIFSGGVVLKKEGSGTQVLTGANTYTGTTTVSAGTLKLGEGGKLKNGTYAGGLEIANVSTTGTTPAVFEHNGTEIQVFSGLISSGTGTGTGANLGTFRQSGTGKSIINSTINTFTGNVDITGGFLGGTGNLRKANGLTVGVSGSIGGGNGVDAGGTLTVPNLTFSGANSKLIVTPASSTNGAPSLVEVKTSADAAGTVTAAAGFKVELVGTNLVSGHILKCTNGAGLSIPTLVLPDNSPLAGKVRLTWDSQGLWMQVRVGTITLALNNAKMVCPKKGAGDGNPDITFTVTYSDSNDLPPGEDTSFNNFFTLSPETAKSSSSITVSKSGNTVTAAFGGASSSADLTYTITYDDRRNPVVISGPQRVNRQPTVSVKSGARLTDGKYTTCFLGTDSFFELQGAGYGLAGEGNASSGRVIIYSRSPISIVILGSTDENLTAKVYTKAVSDDISFFLTDGDGCNSEDLLVSVKENPVITPASATICATSNTGVANSINLEASHDRDPDIDAVPWVVKPAVDGLYADGLLGDRLGTFYVVGNTAITAQVQATVEYTDYFGCKGTAVITVNPNPVVTPPSTICAAKGDGAANSIAISATHNPALTTPWVIDPAVGGVSVAAGTSSTDGGATTFSVTPTSIREQKQATVIYTDDKGCKGRTTITVNPVPVISVSPATATICTGEKTAIRLSPSNLSEVESHRVAYSWEVTSNALEAQSRPDNPQASFEQQTLTNKGTAESSVTYTFTPWYTPANANNASAARCQGQTGTSIYTVVPRGEVGISNTTPAKVCLDDQITLKAKPTGAAYRYQWLKNGAPVQDAAKDSLRVSTANVETSSYAVNVTSSACVTTSDSRRVEVTEDAYFIVNPASAKMDKMEVELNRPVSFTYTGPNAEYSWDFGDKTAAASTQNASHSYSNAGTYKPTLSVIKPKQAKCKKTLALPDLKITPITGDLNGSAAISVYPVPAEDRLTIVNDGGDLQNITIRDISGKTVMSEAVNGSKATVSVAHLTNGIYLLTVTGSKGVKHLKISKN